MRKSVSSSVAVLFGLVLPAIASATSADGSYNKVTISGRITQATAMVAKESGGKLLTSSKLASRSVTNAVVLDAMVQAGLLQTKTGYQLMERLQNGGASEGFFAINSKTGGSVAIPGDLLSAVLASSGETGASAYSKTARIKKPLSLLSENVDFIQARSGVFLSTPVSIYLTGSRTLLVKNYCRTVSYQAVLRGPLGENQVIDLKIVSKTASFIYLPPSDGGGDSGVIVINLPVGP